METGNPDWPILLVLLGFNLGRRRGQRGSHVGGRRRQDLSGIGQHQGASGLFSQWNIELALQLGQVL